MSLSSTEAEFISLAEASQEALWLKKLVKTFYNDIEEFYIYEDNQSCLKLIQNDKYGSTRSKHIDIKYHFVKDLFQRNFFKYLYCPTETMLADLLTKPLPSSRLTKLRTLVGLTSDNN